MFEEVYLLNGGPQARGRVKEGSQVDLIPFDLKPDDILHDLFFLVPLKEDNLSLTHYLPPSVFPELFLGNGSSRFFQDLVGENIKLAGPGKGRIFDSLG